MIRISMLSLVFVFLAMQSTGCSKVLSRRTDEQAWIEFDREVKSGRVPATETDTHVPGLNALHETLAQIPVRTLLLKCGTSIAASVCYREALVLQFDEAFRKIQSQFSELKATDYKREQKSFLELRTFAAVTDEVNRFHQSILSGLELKARVHAQDLFTDCAADTHKEAIIENFNVLSSIVFQMPKGVYACLSEHWSADQKTLLEETTDRLGLTIVTDEAKHWIKDQQISPIYESEVNATVGKKAQAEAERFHLNQKTEMGYDPVGHSYQC